MKILIVLTSHDQLGDTGKKTGFWLEEFAAPYYVLKDAVAAITLASAKGGQPPLDEPVVSYGPFVMNTEAEIRQAMQDYRGGRMGRLPAPT